jgi:hypothetical protein
MVSRVTAAFSEGVATPTPDLLLAELFVHNWPIAFGDIVAGELRVARDSPPGEEDAKMFRTEVSGHADQIPDKTDLGFPHLGNGIAEVVVRGNSQDFDPIRLMPST